MQNISAGAEAQWMVYSMSAELALQSVLQMYTCNQNLLIDNQLHIRCALLVRSKSLLRHFTKNLLATVVCSRTASNASFIAIV